MAVGEVEPNEQTLIDLSRAGDRRAFSELVRLHQDEVFTLANRLVNNREQAADVAQDAFVRAWRAIGQFRGDAKFSTWLHRIVVNTAWTSRRSQRHHAAAPLDDMTFEPTASGAGPQELATLAALRPQLLAALGKLSPPVRTVVVMKDIYDWPHREIVDQLGISTAAAKVRLHRGRKQLYDLLWRELGDNSWVSRT